MAMSKKDYDILAAIIRDVRRVQEKDEQDRNPLGYGIGVGVAMEIQNRMAYVFKEANANFDIVRWADACRPKPGG